jgi:hypothetical protein
MQISKLGFWVIPRCLMQVQADDACSMLTMIFPAKDKNRKTALRFILRLSDSDSAIALSPIAKVETLK